MKHTFPLLILAILFSCNIHRKQSDKIVKNFDSVNQTLNKTNEQISQSNEELYDMVVKMYSETFLQQFRYKVSDFKGYMKDLKRKFIIACGDSTGTMLPENILDVLEQTKNFFSKGNGKNFFFHFSEIQQLFLEHTGNPGLKERIKKLTEVPYNRNEDGFMKTYFYNTPPVAALTILSKFENDINIIESQILQEYLSKK